MTQRSTSWLSQHTLLVLVGLYSVALLLRLVYYFALGDTLMAHVLLMDEAYYQAEARNIILGVPQPTDSWFMTPLYPYFLSLIFRFHDAPMAAYLVQMLLGALLAPLGFLLARKIMGTFWALASAIAIACFAPLVFFEGLLLVESLVAVTLTGSLVLALYGAGNFRMALLSGILLGVAILGRGSNMVLVPLWLTWFLWSRRTHEIRSWRREWLGCLLGCLLPLVPLFVYNATHAKQPLFLTANGGFNLYLGNGPQATGIFQLPEDLDLAQDPLALRYVQRRIQEPVTASEAQHFWLRETVDHVRQHPARAAQLLLWKFLLFWNRTSFPQVEGFETAIVDLPLARLPFWRSLWVLPLALLGIGLAFVDRRSEQRPQRLFLAASVLLFAAAISLFFITDRYRIAILPVTILLAVLPLEVMMRYWQSGRRVASLFLALALVALIFLTDGSRLAIDHNRMRRDIHIHDALRFAKVERYDAAVAEYQQALQLDPGSPQVLDGLARLYARAGYDSLALEQLRGLLRDDPENARSWYNLGNLYRRLDRHNDAIQAYQKSLSVEPRREAAWNNLGESYRAVGDTVRAEQAYRQALAIVPGHEQAWNNLGALLAMRGEAAASEAAFRSAIESNPRYAPGWTNLAILLTNQGRYTEAVDAWRSILRIDPQHQLAGETLRRIEAAGGTAP